MRRYNGIYDTKQRTNPLTKKPMFPAMESKEYRAKTFLGDLLMRKNKDFENYFINAEGKIFKETNIGLTELKPYLDSKGRYLMIKLSKDGKRYVKLMHRIVAEAYLENPNNLPEVNHKDKNPSNNKVENLNWCSRKENLIESYETMSPVRNFKNCALYKNNIKIKDFQSVSEACRYASEEFGISYSAMRKYNKSGIYKIVKM